VLFYAGAAGDGDVRSWAVDRRREGLLVRLWQYDDASFLTDPPASFAATDVPYAEWYAEYCASVGCVE
jgi:hypothetical protein